jgi:hypothetical protein
MARAAEVVEQAAWTRCMCHRGNPIARCADVVGFSRLIGRSGSGRMRSTM